MAGIAGTKGAVMPVGARVSWPPTPVPVPVPDAVEAGAVTLLMMDELHTMSEPPPLAELLHWLIVTSRSASDVEPVPTVQVNELPPPLTESLHWVMSALVVLRPSGLQARSTTVPPANEPLHWLTVAATGVPTPVMSLTTLTEQCSEPPLVIAKLHCVTEVTRSVERVVFWVQLAVRSGLAAPWHSFTVTDEPEAPVATFSVLTTVMSHCIPKPGVSSTLLHCAIVEAEAGEAGPKATASIRAAAPVRIAAQMRFRRPVVRVLDLLVMNPPPKMFITGCIGHHDRGVTAA